MHRPASSDQLLTTLFDFHDRDDTVAESARAQILEERTHLARTCPQTTPIPVTHDGATSACVRAEKIDYAETNPNRLVRVTLARRFGVVPTTDVVTKIAESINANADEIDQ